jgi:C1A family cysteine protease
MNRKIKKYGWKPDLPDQRDYLFSAPIGIKIPSKIDLRAKCPPVYDQGDLGSCTGNAIAGAIQFEQMKQNLATETQVPSRLFIYYNERVIEGTVDTDAGAAIRDGITTVAKQGACYEGTAANEWPYDISQFAVKPPAACYQAATLDKAVQYLRLSNTAAQMKGCLYAGYPFVFGFTVYESFESQQVATTGVVPMPAMNEQVLGGHAVVCVGYDDSQRRYICRNSWGTSWGMAGYFTIPYEYLLSSSLASDFWTIRLVS